MLTNKKLFFLAILAVFAVSAEAQNTNSPYSRYGYGVLNDKAIGASKGMGGISYGVRGQNVNPGNPASYSSIDSLTFLFDIGVSYTNSRFKTPGASQNDDNGGLDYLALQFPIAKGLAVSVGFLPYSSVGYQFGNEVVENGLRKKYDFQGAGGLSQIYGGLSYRVFKNLSIGANVAYLYGRAEHSRSMSILSESVPAAGEYKKLSINSARFDIGVQYLQPLTLLGSKNLLTVGAVYTPAIKPSARMLVISTDTVSYGVDTQLPHTFGLGFTLSNNRTLLYGVDVTYQKWADLNYPGQMGDELSSADRFNNRLRVNAGVEYLISPFERNFFKRLKFRAGLNYSNSYLNVKEKSTGKTGGYKEYGATLGLGLPIRDSYTGKTSYINVSFEYTKLAPEISTMIKEDYIGVSVGMNLNDLWFVKNKFR
ncbi:OmpP1/FadL family transporter [Viscerimonas tarda]